MTTSSHLLKFEPSDPEFIENPYPIYKQLRRCAPIYKSSNGYWVITRYADVFNCLRDSRFSNSPSPSSIIHKRNREKHTAADVANNIIPFKNPPEQTLARKLISRSFHRYLQFDQLNIKKISEKILQGYSRTGKIDILNNYGTPLSVEVMCNILGFPIEDREKLKNWGEWFFYLFAIIPSPRILQKIDQALNEFRNYIKEQIKLRERNPRNDMLTVLNEAKEGQYKLTENEIIDTCILLFADGIENVDRNIGNSILTLLNNPDQMRALLAKPQLLGQAIGECLRYETPAQFLGRIAKEDIPIGDEVIKKNDVALLILGSANRDDAKYQDADEFDITRETKDYLSFGTGSHSCIGASLARTVTEEAISVILENLRNLELATTHIKWKYRFGHRWLESLPVKFEPF